MKLHIKKTQPATMNTLALLVAPPAAIVEAPTRLNLLRGWDSHYFSGMDSQYLGGRKDTRCLLSYSLR